MSDNARWVRPLGSGADHRWEVVIDDRVDGWRHTGLYAGRLADGESRAFDEGQREAIVVPLSGSVAVACVDAAGEKHEAELAGRASVFAGPTDVAYLPAGSETTITARGAARVALAVAVTGGSGAPRPFRHVAADRKSVV